MKRVALRRSQLPLIFELVLNKFRHWVFENSSAIGIVIGIMVGLVVILFLKAGLYTTSDFFIGIGVGAFISGCVSGGIKSFSEGPKDEGSLIFRIREAFSKGIEKGFEYLIMTTLVLATFTILLVLGGGDGSGGEDYEPPPLDIEEF